MKKVKKSKAWYNDDPDFLKEKERYKDPIPSRSYLKKIINERAISTSKLIKQLDLDENRSDALKARLSAMVRDYEIIKRSDKKYSIFRGKKGTKPKSRKKEILEEGVVSVISDFGFLLLKDMKDAYIPNELLNLVMNGDKVKASVFFDNKERPYVKEILNVLERAVDNFTGIILENPRSIKKGLYLTRVRVGKQEKLVEIESNDILLRKNNTICFSIKSYPSLSKNNILLPMKALALNCLGELTPYKEETNNIYSEYNISAFFSEEAQKEANKIKDFLTKEDLLDRKDLRNLPFVTIDGDDSRDFDDAVFAKKTPTGFKLYVSIADVANYVKPKSALDIGAYKRGTSVYFPNHVIPMLPEKLSNGICSLNPLEDRLTITCEIQIDNNGIIKRSHFYESVIRSHKRFTYSFVEDTIFSLKEKNSLKDEKNIRDTLYILKDLYEVMLNESKKRGSLEFSRDEASFVFDENDKVLDLKLKRPLASNKLIEVFMIAANICAAKFLQKNKVSGIFRNHEGPRDDKKEDLFRQLKENGVMFLFPSKKEAYKILNSNNKINEESDISTKQISVFLDRIKDNPKKEHLKTIVLRSMFQAVYQIENKGHFGLSLDDYTHFTSPIRRYPDLLVHRAIKDTIHNKALAKKKAKESIKEREDIANHCSKMERVSESASNSMNYFCQCLFMERYIGHEFSGIITGIRNFGIFVLIKEYGISGLLHISELKDDDYIFNEEKEIFYGYKTKKTYKMGDDLDVILYRVLKDERKIDFTLPVKDTSQKIKKFRKNKK